MISEYQPNKIYDWDSIQGALIEKSKEYAVMLNDQGIPKPWHFSATLLNAKGYRTTTLSGWHTSEVLERNVINSLIGILRDDNTIDDALKPVMDSLLHAFGFRSSSRFEQDNG